MAIRKGHATWPKDRASRVSVHAVETLGGHRTLTVAEIERTQVFYFDPGGASRNVVLPAEAACEGAVIWISNRADDAEVLTIQDDAAGTVCTPAQNEAAVVICNGTVWLGLVGAQS